MLCIWATDLPSSLQSYLMWPLPLQELPGKAMQALFAGVSDAYFGQPLQAQQQQAPATPAEAKMMRTLEGLVAKLGGGQLPGGWRCEVRTRLGPNGAPRNDAYYTSPEGVHFRRACSGS